MKNAVLALTLLPISLLLGACAGTPNDPTASGTANGSTLGSAAVESAPSASTKDAVATELSAPLTREVPIPADSLYPLLAAEFALRNRDFDRALTLLLEQALVLEDPAVARRALQLAEFKDRDDAALALAMRLTEIDPEDAAAASTAMGLLIQAGDSERALAFAREAKQRGARINAPALLINLEQLPPERQTALASAIEALASDWPDDVDIAVALALVKRQLSELAESATVLERILQQDPREERALVLWTQVQIDLGANDAFTRMQAAVDADPDNEDLRLQLARLLASSEHIDEARVQFNALLSLSPRNGDYLFSLALIELETQNFIAARRHLEALLALGQRVDEAHYYLGRLAQDEGDRAAAIAAYLEVGPSREFLDAIRRSGELLLDEGRRLPYRDMFVTARRRNPGQAERLYMLQADLLRQYALVPSAIEVYSEALEVLPESLPLRYGRAMAFESEGDIAAMERDLRDILDANPDNATTLNALGYTLTVHTTRYAEAAALIERALELSPGDAAILDSLGWVYFKMGRLEEAFALLNEAYSLFPDPEVAAHLGELLWRMGREGEARALLSSALEQDPDNSHVADAMQRLGAALDG